MILDKKTQIKYRLPCYNTISCFRHDAKNENKAKRLSKVYIFYFFRIKNQSIRDVLNV
jgi:hypothetical protein